VNTGRLHRTRWRNPGRGGKILDARRKLTDVFGVNFPSGPRLFPPFPVPAFSQRAHRESERLGERIGDLAPSETSPDWIHVM
jgi:hypothetical protein